MTNLEQNPELSKIKNRIAIINNRFDRLIELNQTHHYTFMVLNSDGKLVANPKQDNYLNLLLEIRSEKHKLWMKIREIEPKVLININKGIKAVSTLTKNHLFQLTSPLL